MPHHALCDALIADRLPLIRSGYLEVPDLHLTSAQARRLWGLDDMTSSPIFTRLVELGFLKRRTAATFAPAVHKQTR
jgi:hypothetical protein